MFQVRFGECLIGRKASFDNGLKFIKKVKNGVHAFAASAVFDIDAFESFLPYGVNNDMRNEHEALKQMFPKPVK